MKIVLHAGLHKSGTTAVQAGWRDAFGEHASVWYPSRRAWRQPGHHLLVWPLMGAFVREDAPDLVMAHRRRATGAGESLESIIVEAESRGVQILAISTEELDRIQADDLPALREALRGHDVTALLTVTRPAHRWCSGWQELVKHGLPAYPGDAAPHVLRFASLEIGRLVEISRLLPAARTVVRLVRTEPPELRLAADTASIVGLPEPAPATESKVRNRSLGTDIEIVRRINEADLGLGTVQRAGKELLKRIREDGITYADVPGLEDRYRFPDALFEAARSELAFLDGDHGDTVTVVDPHELRSTWLDPTPPDWYAAISKREAVVPWLQAGDPAEQRWRLRQERAALEARLQRVERKLAESRGGGV